MSASPPPRPVFRTLTAVPGLAAKECRLLEIVKELGETLMSETDELRARGESEGEAPSEHES